MNLWHDLEPGPSIPDVIHVIVEIPKGSRNKYEYHNQYSAKDVPSNKRSAPRPLEW